MKTTVVPFLRPDIDAVRHAGWYLANAVRLPLAMEHWDFQTTLTIEAAVTVERAAIMHASALSPNTELAYVVTGRSSHTGVRGLLCIVPIPDQSVYELALRVSIPGHALGGRLTIESLLVVTEPHATNPLAPRRPGSVLHRTSHHVFLEGSGAQFPTDAADFALSHPDQQGAAWLLHTDLSDPETLFMSAVRLTINSSSSIGTHLLEGGASEDAATARRVLRWDVTRQLVMRALNWEEIDDSQPDFQDESVRGVLRALLAMVWPRDTPSFLRNQLRDRPEYIELAIQNHASLAN